MAFAAASIAPALREAHLSRGAVLHAGLTGVEDLTRRSEDDARSAVVTALILLRRTAERRGAEALDRPGAWLAPSFRVAPPIADPALEAAHLAVELRQRITRYAEGLSLPIGIRIGISSGLLTPELGLDGEPMAEASALVDLAAPGRIYVDRATRDASRDAFSFREVRADRSVFADAPLLGFELLTGPGAPVRRQEKFAWIDPAATRSSSPSARGVRR